MIPRPLDRLFGRSAELAELERRFEAGALLSTLLGPGGVGKTRLALEHARRVEAGGAEAIFCDLSTCRSRQGVLSQVARELAAKEVGTEELARAVAARGRVLLILDNAEQVLPWVRELVTACLAVSEQASLLITSRHPLGMGGEAPLEVRPLQDPKEAEGLLLDRAALSGRAPPTEASLQQLVGLLDGWPLAIELAAARLELLTPEQLIERLRAQRTALGKPALGERHRTLTACIAWSWELLTEREQLAASSLAALPGGFSVELAEGLLGQLRDPDPTECVHALRSHSLLARRAGHAGPRFVMLEAVRQFFVERADGNGDIAVRQLARFAEEWLAQTDGQEAAVGFAQLRDEQANLRWAVERASGDADLQDCVPSLLRALERSAAQTGSDAELMEVAQSVAGRATSRAARCQAALSVGRGAFRTGQLDVAASALKQAEGFVETPSERARLALAMARLSYNRGQQLALAERQVSLARDASRDANEPLVEAAASSLLGVVLHVQGRIDEAQAAYGDALERVAPDCPRLEATLRAQLGFLYYDLERQDDAESELHRSLELHRRLGLDQGTARLQAVLGNLARSRGDGDEARALYGQAIAHCQRAGDRVYEAVYTMDLGILLALESRYLEAERELAEALAIAEACGAKRVAALILGYLAVCRGRHDSRAAAAALERAETLLQVAEGDPLQLLLSLHRSHLEVLAGDEAAARRCLADAESSQVPMEHVRLAARLLRAALLQSEAPDEALLISEDACWVRPPQGSWQDLSRRESARRLLAALIEQRQRNPGTPLSFERLIEVGWPGERLVASAAKNRLRVAVTFLRRLGLGDALSHQDGGYLLAAELPVIRTTPHR